MARPCSSDLRQRAIALVEAGRSRRAVARLLNPDKSTVILWAKEYRATGKQAAKPMGRRRFAVLAERGRLLARIAAAHLLFLPPYSPDLNPIEMVFAKLKTLLRKADERSISAVRHRIGSLLQDFGASGCADSVRHAGYDRT